MVSLCAKTPFPPKFSYAPVNTNLQEQTGQLSTLGYCFFCWKKEKNLVKSRICQSWQDLKPLQKLCHYFGILQQRYVGSKRKCQRFCWCPINLHWNAIKKARNGDDEWSQSGQWYRKENIPRWAARVPKPQVKNSSPGWKVVGDTGCKNFQRKRRMRGKDVNQQAGWTSGSPHIPSVPWAEQSQAPVAAESPPLALQLPEQSVTLWHWARHTNTPQSPAQQGLGMDTGTGCVSQHPWLSCRGQSTGRAPE